MPARSGTSRVERIPTLPRVAETRTRFRDEVEFERIPTTAAPMAETRNSFPGRVESARHQHCCTWAGKLELASGASRVERHQTPRALAAELGRGIVTTASNIAPCHPACQWWRFRRRPRPRRPANGPAADRSRARQHPAGSPRPRAEDGRRLVWAWPDRRGSQAAAAFRPHRARGQVVPAPHKPDGQAGTQSKPQSLRRRAVLFRASM